MRFANELESLATMRVESAAHSSGGGKTSQTMNILRIRMKALIVIGGIVLSLGLSTACAKTDSEPAATENAAEAAPPAAVTAPAAAAEPAAKEPAGYGFSDGMRIPVDGSSIEAFDNSLQTIKAKTSESEYKTLNGALSYLMIYDLSAKRDRAKLAKNLDGLTGEQIVDKVGWNNTPKNRNPKKQSKPGQTDQ